MDSAFQFLRTDKGLIALLLIALSVLVYLPVKDYPFISYDNSLYVTENWRVQEGLSWENVKWALVALEAGFWHPLTWLSHMLDCTLFGLDPAGHHLTSVVLHIGSTLFLFLAFVRMTCALWPSFFVAALFAIHPLHVESVAWVAERKDTLSIFFWMLTMWTYIRYTEKSCTLRYLLVFLCFALGLMSKPMLVTLPIVLLLLDFWPLGRFQLKELGYLKQKKK